MLETNVYVSAASSAFSYRHSRTFRSAWNSSILCFPVFFLALNSLRLYGITRIKFETFRARHTPPADCLFCSPSRRLQRGILCLYGHAISGRVAYARVRLGRRCHTATEGRDTSQPNTRIHHTLIIFASPIPLNGRVFTTCVSRPAIGPRIHRGMIELRPSRLNAHAPCRLAASAQLVY